MSMADEPQNPQQDPAAEAPEATESQPTEDSPWQGETDDTAPDPIAVLEQEKAELKDQLLRTLAEMENLRRRTEKQVRDASEYAIANFARDALVVGDNLRRTIDALPEDERAQADGTLKALLEGVEMTERDLASKLEKHGVRQIDPMGEKFDPNFHQAMFEVPDSQTVSGTVVQVVQIGYLIGERMLRPAMVGIAKGGPKSAPTPEPAADSETQPDESPGGQIDRTA